MSKQLVNPNPNITDAAGFCLRFTQSVWGAPVRYATAWDAWKATQYKHADSEPLPDVAVILWFDHWGTYGGVTGQYGHVVTYFPGRGFLSSPTSGVGQKWLNSPGEVERVYNSKYVGWSEDINGLRVAEIGDEMNDEQNNALMSVYKATFFGGGDAGEKSIIQRLSDIENKVNNGSAAGGLTEADVIRILKSISYKAQ